MPRLVLCQLPVLVTLLLASVCVAQEAVLETATPPKSNTAIVPVPRDGNWMKRHESFNERVQKGNVDLLMIGDSITHGWEGAGREVWEKYYGDRNAVNLGIGGDRTQHVLWRLQNGNIENISPKLAVLMIGTNNCGSNTPEEIAEGVEAIVDELRTELPNMKVLILAIFPRGEDDTHAGRQVNMKANELIKELADGDMVYFLDINSAFLSDNRVLTREVMPDLLHPKQKGYAIWAEAMEPTVAKLMGDS
ncbi:platelet-activating factor acetylhydrolase IB subunit [Allorhodopirellula heiligendammensis]|uniref:GDSL-like Lipase/Acylhydrolase n=1 Tax=Allorhodopirellula heiligendammensis TaxID=2714739 RepID=A0A5C6BVQ1_9BACT|nr:platelet-activating factor acetylhydrolase IB subunit [Allorhodopirellula heiligendammensis]TWU15501.1 GDSL-like Lipase/Acylhydrolase [Allorhodopirellula heiligendammensis]